MKKIFTNGKYTALFFILMLSGCATSKQQKNTETKTPDVMDYSFSYRVFGGVNVNANNTKQPDTTNIDNKKTGMSRQDSAFMYRVFGGFNNITR